MVLRLSLAIILFIAIAFGGYKVVLNSTAAAKEAKSVGTDTQPEVKTVVAPVIEDLVEYDNKIAHITNGDTTGKWPVKTQYPLAGAIIPFKRIVSFYGNLYSKQMGILGELPPDQMLAKLQQEVAVWGKAGQLNDESHAGASLYRGHSAGEPGKKEQIPLTNAI